VPWSLSRHVLGHCHCGNRSAWSLQASPLLDAPDHPIVCIWALSATSIFYSSRRAWNCSRRAIQRWAKVIGICKRSTKKRTKNITTSIPLPWKLGTAFICSFVLPLLLHAFFPSPAEIVEKQEQNQVTTVKEPRYADADEPKFVDSLDEAEEQLKKKKKTLPSLESAIRETAVTRKNAVLHPRTFTTGPWLPAL